MGNDVPGLATTPPEPPPVVTELRRALDALAAPYGELVVVSHLDADPDFDPAEQCPVDAEWITSLEPTARGQRIEVRYDGDGELFLFIGDVGFLQWGDHSDVNGVVAEATGICAGVIAGDIWEWRTAHERGCEVVGPDARRWRLTDGRPRWKYWPPWALWPVRHRRLVGYVS